MDTLHRQLGLVLLFVLCFLGLRRDLWTPDEPREAEISREMSLSPGVVPTLNGRDFIEKPPFYYWTVAGVFALVGPSPAAARAVSAAASFLTLWLVFLWGHRELSAYAGFGAALALATSSQFLISSHWIVMDPLLMLFTTAALWAAFELVRDRHDAGSRTATLLSFYAALILALWTKGLIGPVLVASGLLAYAAVRRSFEPIRRVRPFTGIAVIVVMTCVIAALIYLESGLGAVREWLYVNHALRFVAPQYTGHDQPFYYYVFAVPVALFPWWVPFVALFRPSAWRAAARRRTFYVEVYLGAVSLGMALILSAAATKRALYLLPMLPPLFLLLAARVEAWWRERPARSLGVVWNLQAAFIVLFAAAPTMAMLAYLGRADAAAAALLAAVALAGIALAIFSARAAAARALGTIAAIAVTGTAGLLVVDTRLAASFKDLTPFVSWIQQQVPPGSPLTVTGDLDETVEAIVPFLTGDRVVAAMPSEIPGLTVRYVLVQDKNGGRTARQLPEPYELVADKHFGPGRYIALWRRAEAKTSARPPLAGKH